MSKKAFHKVVAGLQVLLQPIKALREDPNNARFHPPENIDAIAWSLQEYGQRTPIVVNVKGGLKTIEKGNGTFVAAQRLGWTHIAAVLVKDTEEMHRAYALADNKTALTSAWDMENLAAAIKAIPQEALLNTGWNAPELESILSGTLEPPPPVEPPREESPSTKSGDQTVVFSPSQWEVIAPVAKAVGGGAAALSDRIVAMAKLIKEHGLDKKARAKR